MLGLGRRPRLIPRMGWGVPQARRRRRAGTPHGNRARERARQITFRADIVEVSDGDGLRVETGRGKTIEVRLADIDAPEYDQPGGREAKTALRKLVREGGRRATVTAQQRPDRYGRMIATVTNAKGCLNERLVEQGHAWVEPRYARGKIERTYSALERAARRTGRGLWSGDEDPVPPWTWRKRGTTQAGRAAPREEARERRTSTAQGQAPRPRSGGGSGKALALVLIIAAVVTMCTTATQSPHTPGRDETRGSAPDTRTSTQEARDTTDTDRSVHQRVRDIQRMLDTLGYEPGPIDGLWGPRTQRAFERFAEREAPGREADAVARRLGERYAARRAEEERRAQRGNIEEGAPGGAPAR